FRREKYVPMGGPAGGDGGRGGDVVFEVRRNLRTLVHLRYQQTFKAQSGVPGMGKNRYGKDGEDIVIAVPPGTIIKDFDSGEIIKDFGAEKGIAGAGRLGGAKQAARDGDSLGRWTFLKGGRGGWGNSHFATSVNQAPRIAHPGQPGKTAKLKIELQLIGDIGFVGFPNAGKSSLLDNFTNARPKIAPYPFTTKIPNLGMLHIHDRDIVLADIPGIIEGAHEGAGLGIRFLKHIARTAALAFLIDLSDDNWKEAFPILVEELRSFSPVLADKRRIIIGTKLDLPESEGRFGELEASLPGEKVMGISVFSGQGLDELKELFHRMVLEAEDEATASGAGEEDFFGIDEDLEADSGDDGMDTKNGLAAGSPEESGREP
ncbi:MAG TPA: GTPase ObgE, partial [Rectinemataceae bacterium]|nr:GTPase ObgE [Rectinemataceae bacterium]